MSYCRWSSMDYDCDLYIYESESGFEIHVARRRPDIDRSKLPPPVDISSVPPSQQASMEKLWRKRNRV